MFAGLLLDLKCDVPITLQRLATLGASRASVDRDVGRVVGVAVGLEVAVGGVAVVVPVLLAGEPVVEEFGFSLALVVAALLPMLGMVPEGISPEHAFLRGRRPAVIVPGVLAGAAVGTEHGGDGVGREELGLLKNNKSYTSNKIKVGGANREENLQRWWRPRWPATRELSAWSSRPLRVSIQP